MGDRRTPEEKLESAERTREMWEMRYKGMKNREIATHFGISESAVCQRLNKYIQDRPKDSADLYIGQQLDELDRLRTALEPFVDAGSFKHIEQYMKVLERQAKLMGLDKPVETKVEVVDATPDHIRDLLAKRAKHDG